ncbi:hypothetical protein [Corynebacterium sp. p3-SID1056]|uniref:hypothetical protein n=1 Tax=Corynebacterium sp. p3-SID1056 TaxID=2916092 RepID=UPI0021A3F0F9|nr:hypothetical protein [Corynebacterium sp. p3-SID1056]MCT2338587.1 hypothetical protein [Corynebacterium sp. p3-SID1056]
MNHKAVSNDLSLDLKLNGDLNSIDATTVIRGLDLLRKLVAGLSPEGSPIKMGKLEEGSSVTGVLVSGHLSARISTGIEHIRSQRTMPSGWTSREAKIVRDLAQLSKRAGVESVELLQSNQSTRTPLDPELISAVNETLDRTAITIGSVIGELYSYHVTQRGLVAKLRESLSGNEVKVNFKEDLDEEVRSHLRQEVEISGILTRHPESHRAEEIDAKSVESLNRPAHKINPRGIWRDLANEGATTESMMAAIRVEGYDEVNWKRK